MAYQSHVARGALRAALRQHPQCDSVLQGRLVNNLTIAELHKCLDALGINPIAVAANARETTRQNVWAGEVETAPCDNLPHAEPMETTPAVEAPDAIDAAIEAELSSLRQLVGTGGFAALDDRLRQLVKEARKPAVEVRVEVPIDVVPGAPVHVSQRTGQRATWRQLFDVRGPMGRRETELWDRTHPNTPAVNDRYLWPQPATAIALSQLHRGRNLMLYGPAGTGKTEFAQQLAARTGRPFALISCDNGTDAATLVGMTVPDVAGGVTWQDGQLTKAIKTPGCVVCIDEPSVARPGALMVFQNVLEKRVLFIGETGARVPVANGVLFMSTDNTNGMGGGARRGYTDTNRLNAAFLDRFGVRVTIDYLPPDREADVIVGYTGCTVELARLLVSAATVTRAAANDQTLSHGIGLRRLLSWAELLTDGIDAEEAFRAAVLNCAADQDVETLREQCLLSYDKATVKAALNPNDPLVADPCATNPTPAGRDAAGEFTNV